MYTIARLVLVGCLALLAAPTFAFQYEDYADDPDYSDGVQAGEVGSKDGCVFFGPWSGSAATAASPSGLIDTSGVAFEVGPGSINRQFEPLPASPNTIFSVELEGSSTSALILFALNVRGTGEAISISAQNAFPNWTVVAQSASLSTIPGTDPVRVTITTDGGTGFDLTITPLLGGADFTYSGTFNNSISGNDIDELELSGSAGALLYANNLIYDNTDSFPAAATCPPAGPYLYSDDASQADYADGLDIGDQGNTGFGRMKAWQTGGGSIAASPSGLLDTGGVAWLTTTNQTRGFINAPVDPEVIVEVDLEIGSMPVTSTVTWSLFTQSGLGGTGLTVDAAELAPNWLITGDTTIVTTVPRTEPIRVQVTAPGVGGTPDDVDVTIRSLSSSAVDTRSLQFGGSSPNWNEIDSVRFNANSGASLYFNNFVLDETGTLPVEVSAFELE